jgi:uncharacterized membrane protein YdcZ (DUF606 family)
MGYCVLSLVLGALTVLQATINGKAGSTLGMGGALIINTSVLIISVITALFLKLMPVQLSYSQFRWWYLWPGFLGFIVLLYLPISIDKIGALVSFLWCLAGQLLLGNIAVRFNFVFIQQFAEAYASKMTDVAD